MKTPVLLSFKQFNLKSHYKINKKGEDFAWQIKYFVFYVCADKNEEELKNHLNFLFSSIENRFVNLFLLTLL